MFPSDFDPQPTLESDALLLRPLLAADRAGLQAAASDPRTWAGHPSQDRFKPEVFGPYLQFLLAAGGTLVVVDRPSERIIGCSRFYPAPDQPGSVSIGFTFLDQAYWGGATNRAMKALMLEHAYRRVSQVWFHIAPSNIRSQRATVKLGAEHAYDATLDLSGTPAPWMCFRLTRGAWERGRGTG